LGEEQGSRKKLQRGFDEVIPMDTGKVKGRDREKNDWEPRMKTWVLRAKRERERDP